MLQNGPTLGNKTAFAAFENADSRPSYKQTCQLANQREKLEGSKHTPVLALHSM